MMFVETLDWFFLDCCGLISYTTTIITNCLKWFYLTHHSTEEEINITKDGGVQVLYKT